MLSNEEILQKAIKDLYNIALILNERIEALVKRIEALEGREK